MKFILSLFFILSTSSLWALNYDPAFHLRHRYNSTQQSLKEKHVDMKSADRVQDPRIGLKGQPVPRYYKIDKE